MRKVCVKIISVGKEKGKYLEQWNGCGEHQRLATAGKPLKIKIRGDHKGNISAMVGNQNFSFSKLSHQNELTGHKGIMSETDGTLLLILLTACAMEIAIIERRRLAYAWTCLNAIGQLGRAYYDSTQWLEKIGRIKA